MTVARIIFVVMCCAASQAQSPQSLAFDVASVKPDKFNGNNGTMGFTVEGSTFHAQLVDLNKLITFAWKIEDFQLSGGPSWAANGAIFSSDLFQVMAKAAPGQTPTMDQFRLMVQTLLADRFHLQIHHADKPLPVYNLVVSKGGPNLKETAGGETAMNQHGIGKVGYRIDAINVTIPYVIGLLGFYAHRPIIDKTGLTGHYDFTVKWLLDQTGAADAVGSDLPTLPAAMQEQLGLKLEATTAPYDTIVIDHVEKPSEN